MGTEDRADGAPLRLQRFRLADDRGERRLGGEHDASHDDRAKWNDSIRDAGFNVARRRQDYSILGGTFGAGPGRVQATRLFSPDRPHESRPPAPRLAPRAQRATRVGIGYDSHRFAPPGPLILGGVPIPSDVHLEGTRTVTPPRTRSPTPSSAPRRRATSARCSPIAIPRTRAGIRSRCLRAAVARIGRIWLERAAGRRHDRRRAAEDLVAPRADAHAARRRARRRLDAVSVKGKTNEGMGWIGRGEGIACIAVATMSTSSTRPVSTRASMIDDGAALRFQLDRFGDYLTLEQGTSPLTLEAYRRDVERLVEFARIKGTPSPVDITSRLLREFVYHLKDMGLAPSSIRRNISAVRTYFKFLYRRRRRHARSRASDSRRRSVGGRCPTC